MATEDREERPTTGQQAPTDPLGTVRVHPDDRPDDPSARRFVKVAHGRWTALTPLHPIRAAAPPDEVVSSWPRQPLGHLAQVLEHPGGVVVPRPRRVTARAEHPWTPRTPSHHHRTAPTDPLPTAPTFWEEAKVFCRARNNAFALACHWFDESAAATGEPRARPDES